MTETRVESQTTVLAEENQTNSTRVHLTAQNLVSSFYKIDGFKTYTEYCAHCLHGHKFTISVFHMKFNMEFTHQAVNFSIELPFCHTQKNRSLSTY